MLWYLLINEGLYMRLHVHSEVPSRVLPMTSNWSDTVPGCVSHIRTGQQQLEHSVVVLLKYSSQSSIDSHNGKEIVSLCGCTCQT